VSFVRSVWADLVEKRLWPVAVALVLALVAIPVLLLKPAAEPKAAPSVVANAGPAPLVADPASIASARPSGPVLGSTKNPFAQQHVPAKASTTSTGASTATASTGATAVGGGTSGSSGGATTAPSTGTTSPPSSTPKTPASSGEPRLKVRFGPTDGTRKVRVLSAGQALPSTTNPTLVFVEVHGTKKVEFIVSSDAVPQGDGNCQPSKDVCAQLFLHPGDTEFFDVTKSNGKVVQYQLDVVDVLG
jgi:hypothetical protein